MIRTKAEFVNKPWGWEFIFARTEKYAGKLLHINKGHRLSRQYHVTKDESIFVTNGVLYVEIGPKAEETVCLVVGEGLHIPPGLIHRFCAKTDVDLREVSTGELDDVVRLEDDYHRADPEQELVKVSYF